MNNKELCVVCMFVLPVILSKLQVAITSGDGEIPIASVLRRSTGDFYTSVNSSGHRTCPGDNHTFLVSERICVNDQDLINGKLLMIKINTGTLHVVSRTRLSSGTRDYTACSTQN